MVETEKRRANTAEFLTACYFAGKHPSEVMEVWVSDDKRYEVIMAGATERVTIHVED